MRKFSMIAFLAVAGTASVAAAQPVVPTALTGGTQGSFVAQDFFAAFSSASWFTFTLTEATLVDIDFNRTSAPPDLIASLYLGDITGADATALGVSHGNNFFTNFGSFVHVVTEDDTHEDAFGGPFADPQFILNLDPGTYSIVVTALQGAGAGFTVTSNVPAPGAAGLLGVAGLAALRRRRR